MMNNKRHAIGPWGRGRLSRSVEFRKRNRWYHVMVPGALIMISPPIAYGPIDIEGTFLRNVSYGFILIAPPSQYPRVVCQVHIFSAAHTYSISEPSLSLSLSLVSAQAQRHIHSVWQPTLMPRARPPAVCCLFSPTARVASLQEPIRHHPFVQCLNVSIPCLFIIALSARHVFGLCCLPLHPSLLRPFNFALGAVPGKLWRDISESMKDWKALLVKGGNARRAVTEDDLVILCGRLAPARAGARVRVASDGAKRPACSRPLCCGHSVDSWLLAGRNLEEPVRFQ